MAAPFIKSVQVKSSVSATNGWYKGGSVLTGQVTFSESVFVTGQPQLNLLFGNAIVSGNYLAGASTGARKSAVLNFIFTLPSGILDADGVSSLPNALALSALNTISNASNEQANPLLANPTVFSAFKLDTQAAVLSIPEALNTSSLVKNATQTLEFTSSEAGSAFLLNTNYAFSAFKTAVANTKKTVALGGGSLSSSFALSGLVSGSYRLYFQDVAGNLTTAANLVTLDAVAPTVSVVPRLLSATGISNGILVAGSVLTASVVFSEQVFIQGAPQLRLDVGGVLQSASFLDSSNSAGKTSARFIYTVGTGLRDADGISIAQNSILFNDASIKDAAGNTASLTHSASNSNAAFKVDSAVNALQAVTVHGWLPGDIKTLDAGQVLTLKATFADAVSVVGLPALRVVVAGGIFLAKAVKQTVTGADVFFTLKIPVGLVDLDGISVPQNPFVTDANNKIISPVSKSVTALGFAGAVWEGVNVNSVVPSILGVTLSNSKDESAQALSVGDTLFVSVKFSEAVSCAAGLGFRLTSAGRQLLATYASGNLSDTLVFSYTVPTGSALVGNIQAAVSPFTGGTGTIRDANSVPADLSFAFSGLPIYLPVDTLSPSIVSVALSGKNGDTGGKCGTGSLVTASVLFSELVNVVGQPVLNLKLTASTSVVATYSGGSGTNALTFVYTVGQGDLSPGGISIAANSLKLNGATLADAIGNAAKLTHTVVTENALYKVDAVSASVAYLSVSSIAGGVGNKLTEGDVLTVQANYGEAVSVTGLPSIELSMGNGVRSMTYAGQNAAKTNLLFAYTIVAGDTDTDGLSLSPGNINLQGGSIKDAFGNAVVLAHMGLTPSVSLTVDTFQPTTPNVLVAAEILDGLSFAEFLQNTPVYQVTPEHERVTEVTLTGQDGNSFVRTYDNTRTNGAFSLTFPELNFLGEGMATLSATNIDAAGNRSTPFVVQFALTLTAPADGSPPAAIQAVINLGTYGKLIMPVQVEGKWYYYWDRSGDGTSADGWSSDRTTHTVLDGIFRRANDFSTLDSNNDTDNIYRYATLNGVKVALPTHGGLMDGSGLATDGNQTKTGTAVSSGSHYNAPYDDLLAIWDAFNGSTEGGSGQAGAPSGWPSQQYWSATPSPAGHVAIGFDTGFSVDRNDDAQHYVILQVL